MHFITPSRIPLHQHSAHIRSYVYFSFLRLLRCSELTITSNFNPNIHPTISDLQIVDNETISFFIKQSKTDRAKKGHFVYIFNLPTPIQPFHSLLNYLQYKRSTLKSPLDPLFTDDSNHPATRFWFQKHLKAVLTKSGISANQFSSHSFRIGAATKAAQKRSFPTTNPNPRSSLVIWSFQNLH